MRATTSLFASLLTLHIWHHQAMADTPITPQPEWRKTVLDLDAKATVWHWATLAPLFVGMGVAAFEPHGLMEDIGSTSLTAGITASLVTVPLLGVYSNRMQANLPPEYKSQAGNKGWIFYWTSWGLLGAGATLYALATLGETVPLFFVPSSGDTTQTETRVEDSFLIRSIANPLLITGMIFQPIAWYHFVRRQNAAAGAAKWSGVPTVSWNWTTRRQGPLLTWTF